MWKPRVGDFCLVRPDEPSRNHDSLEVMGRITRLAAGDVPFALVEYSPGGDGYWVTTEKMDGIRRDVIGRSVRFIACKCNEPNCAYKNVTATGCIEDVSVRIGPGGRRMDHYTVTVTRPKRLEGQLILIASSCLKNKSFNPRIK